MWPTCLLNTEQIVQTQVELGHLLYVKKSNCCFVNVLRANLTEYAPLALTLARPCCHAAGVQEFRTSAQFYI